MAKTLSLNVLPKTIVSMFVCFVFFSERKQLSTLYLMHAIIGLCNCTARQCSPLRRKLLSAI